LENGSTSNSNSNGVPIRKRRYVLSSLGTRGDLDPILALGIALRSRGHDVVVATSKNLCEHARQYGLEVHSICGDLSGISGNPLAGLMEIKRSMEENLRTMAAIAEGSCAVIGSGFAIGSPTVAELCNVPFIYSVVSPSFLPESGLLPYIGTPVPTWLSQIGWFYQRLSWNMLFRSKIDAFRKNAEMRPAKSLFAELFQPRSRILAVPPALAGPLAEPRAGTYQSGFLRLPDEGELPVHVQKFLASGTPPMVIAFGSSIIGKIRGIILNLIGAAEAMGLRTLLASSWSDAQVGELPSSVCRCPEVPYSVLFREAGLVVHHGGAGTLASALAAGKPQLILPGFADQLYWARQAFKLGVCPRPILRTNVTKARIAEAMREIQINPRIAERSQKARVEGIAANGAPAAAEWLDTVIN
jgi:UDP:flavonoid glycosyltransferase YjiC (YdhE family)